MRLAQCKDCEHFLPTDAVCGHKGVPIAKLKGCSWCPSARQFYRARSGKEAFRLNVLGKHKGETK